MTTIMNLDECKLILSNSLKRLEAVRERISLAEELPSAEELVDLIVEMSEIDVHLMELCASLIAEKKAIWGELFKTLELGRR